MMNVQVGVEPMTSLNAAGATGAGTGVDLGACYSNCSMQTTVTNTATAVSVTLEGSLNGTNWVVLATSTSTTGDMQFSTGKPVRYLRANLGTLTTATGSTVTARVGAAA